MSFDKLYHDVKNHIISFLDLQTLGRMSQVSKEMKSLIYNEDKDTRSERYIKKYTERGLDYANIFLICCENGDPVDVVSGRCCQISYL